MNNFYRFTSDSNVISTTLDAVKSEDWLNEGGELKVETEPGDEYIKVQPWKLPKSSTTNTQLHKDSKYSLFHNWVIDCLEQVHDDLKLYCDRLDLTQSWANRLTKGQYVHEHTHPNSFISGIYYLTSTDTPTQFAFKNIWYEGWDKPPISLKGDESKIYHSVYTDSNAGDLILFPSTVLHRVDEHKTDDERYTISFNTFPSGTIGDFNDLTGVNVKIK